MIELGLEMTFVIPNSLHRQVMQRLRSGEWKAFSKLDFKIGAPLLRRLIGHGWVEVRGAERGLEIRMTPKGFEAVMAKIPDAAPGKARRIGLKAKNR